MGYKIENPRLYQVLEQFKSIQGEGINIGRWVTFIRLRGCNLNCPWCDTKESWIEVSPAASSCRWMSAEQIVAEIETKEIVITGGEPLLYDIEYLVDCIELSYKDPIHLYDRRIGIETNGTIEIADFSSIWNKCWITCSPKLESGYQCICADEYKIIVDDNVDEDTLPAIIENIKNVKSSTNHIRRPHNRWHPLVWLQPEGNKPENYLRVVKLVEKFQECRAGFQLHKIFNVK